MLSVSRWAPHHYSVNGSFLRVRQGKQWDCPGGTSGKESACQLGDAGLIPGLGKSPGATHCSTLAWKIPWTEKPGGLQFMGLQRV